MLAMIKIDCKYTYSGFSKYGLNYIIFHNIVIVMHCYKQAKQQQPLGNSFESIDTELLKPLQTQRTSIISMHIKEGVL